MSGDCAGLAAASQTSTEHGADRGPAGPRAARAAGETAGYTLTTEGQAYVREWAAKGYPDALAPERFRVPVQDGVSTEVAYFDERVHRIFDRLERVLLAKHKDYGPGNIAQAPGGPLNGLRVRIHDKIARVNHLLDSESEPQYESLEDSFMDLANYAVIAIMVLRKQWPGVR